MRRLFSVLASRVLRLARQLHYTLSGPERLFLSHYNSRHYCLRQVSHYLVGFFFLGGGGGGGQHSTLLLVHLLQVQNFNTAICSHK